jgi:hypothetical protein
MRNKTFLLAGIAAAAIIGFAGLADAQAPVAVHTMTVRLPGGGLETIRYTGDVAPKIVVAPAGMTMPAAFLPTFASFEQIAAQMDRQMGAMMYQMRAMPMMPMMGMPDMNQLMQAAAHNGAGFCAQSVSITSTGNGPAKVVRHSAGNCGGSALAPGGSGQANDLEAVPQAAKPIPIKTTAPAPHPVRQHI